MHQSAMYYSKMFFEVYCSGVLSDNFSIVEIGSQNVNGSMREVAPKGVNYIGVDFVEGNGVDIILDDPYKITLSDSSADIVVTSSCFEHSEFFWLTFIEMCRILKPGGFIYLNAPSNGTFHRYPVDCWRFYPDSGEALAAWARRSGFEITLVESFIGARSDNTFNDFVAVFQKNADLSESRTDLIIKRIDWYTNGLTNSGFTNYSQLTYEMSVIASLTQAVTDRDGQIARLNQAITVRDGQIARLNQAITDRSPKS